MTNELSLIDKDYDTSILTYRERKELKLNVQQAIHDALDSLAVSRWRVGQYLMVLEKLCDSKADFTQCVREDYPDISDNERSLWKRLAERFPHEHTVDKWGFTKLTMLLPLSPDQSDEILRGPVLTKSKLETRISVFTTGGENGTGKQLPNPEPKDTPSPEAVERDVSDPTDTQPDGTNNTEEPQVQQHAKDTGAEDALAKLPVPEDTDPRLEALAHLVRDSFETGIKIKARLTPAEEVETLWQDSLIRKDLRKIMEGDS